MGCYRKHPFLRLSVALRTRDELPGAALQRICSLSASDGIERGVTPARILPSTSLALVDWLDSLQDPLVCCHHRSHQGPRRCICVLRARCTALVAAQGRRFSISASPRSQRVPILGIGMSSDHLDCWDPPFRGARYDHGRGALQLRRRAFAQPGSPSPGPTSKRDPALFLRPARGARRRAHSTHQGRIPAVACGSLTGNDCALNSCWRLRYRLSGRERDQRHIHLIVADAAVHADMDVALFVRQPVLERAVVFHHQRVIADTLREPRMRCAGTEPVLRNQIGAGSDAAAG